MKRINVIIAITLALICILGWFLVFKQQSSKTEQYSAYVEQADTWVEEGLYQRAIQSYQMALAEAPTVEIYTKAVGAFQKRISEVSGDILDDTLDEYTDFLLQLMLARRKKNLCDCLLNCTLTMKTSHKHIPACVQPLITAYIVKTSCPCFVRHNMPGAIVAVHIL